MDAGSHHEHGRSLAVFVPEPNGDLKRVKVQTGVQNESYAELVTGDLRENDRVVVGYKRTETTPNPNAQRPPSFMGGGGGPGRRFH